MPLLRSIFNSIQLEISALARDNFNRADGALGANWSSVGSYDTYVVSSNTTHTSAGSALKIAYNSSVTWPNNQYAKCTVVAPIETASDCGGGPMVRIPAGSLFTGYFIQGNTVETRLYAVVNQGFTQLGSDAGPVVNGDILEIRAVGSQITALKNGVIIIGPITDTSIAAGNAGLFGSPSTTDAIFDDWSGGAL
jgi:hypothetical protein